MELGIITAKKSIMNKEELEQFIRLLQKVQKQPSQTFDLGLIVKESESKINSEEVLAAIRKIVESEKVIYDKLITDEDMIEKIIEAFENNKWIFLEIKKDISSLLLNQLKHLANSNSLRLIDYKGRDLAEIKMPENSRVIVFSERDFIENKITYPYFYRLFGPTLSIK